MLMYDAMNYVAVDYDSFLTTMTTVMVLNHIIQHNHYHFALLRANDSPMAATGRRTHAYFHLMCFVNEFDAKPKPKEKTWRIQHQFNLQNNKKNAHIYKNGVNSCVKWVRCRRQLTQLRTKMVLDFFLHTFGELIMCSLPVHTSICRNDECRSALEFL